LVALCLLAGTVSARDGGHADSPGARPPPFDDPVFVRGVDGARDSKATEERHRESPEARAERERSRTAYRALRNDQAIDVARRKFPELAQDRAYRGSRPGRVEHIERFVDDFSGIVERGDGTWSVVRSTRPLRVPHGRPDEAVDLRLGGEGDWFSPAVPLTDVHLPLRLSDGLRAAGSGIGLVPDAAREDEGVLVDDKVFYPNVGPDDRDTDVIAEAVLDGIEVSFQLRSAASPETHRLELDLPPGAQVRRGKAPFNGLEILADGRTVARLSAPVAWDADREPVPVTYRLEGRTLVMTIDHVGRDVAYPILVDPSLGVLQDHWSQGTQLAGWQYLEDDPYNAIAWNTNGAEGLGLYVYQSPGAAAGNRGFLYFAAPGHSYIYRYESATSHAAEYTTHETGVWTGGAWAGFHFYGASGAYFGWQSAPTPRWWSFSGFYQTMCLSYTAPCGAYEVNGSGQPTGASGTQGNMVLLSLTKNTTAWAASWPYLRAASTKMWLQDDTPPTVSLTSQSAPAGWVENASATVSANASDSGFGVGRMRLSRGALSLEERAWACDTPGPQPCPPSVSTSFSYSTASYPDGIHTMSVTAGDWEGAAQFPRNWSNAGAASWQVKLDRQAPAVPTPGGTLYQATREADGVASGTTYTVVVNAADAGSGVNSVSYKVKSVATGQVVASGTQTNPSCNASGCSQQWAPSFSFDGSAFDGEYAVEATVTDQLAHTRTVELYRASVDHAVPTITGISHTPTGVLGAWHNGTQPIVSTVSASDTAAGVRSFELTYPDGSVETHDKDCGTWDRR
jgi:hypothetical protein